MDLLAELRLHLLLPLVIGVVPLLDSPVHLLYVIADLSVHGHQVSHGTCVHIFGPLVCFCLSLGRPIRSLSSCKLVKLIFGDLAPGQHTRNFLRVQAHNVNISFAVLAFTRTTESVIEILDPIETLLEVLSDLGPAAVFLGRISHVGSWSNELAVLFILEEIVNLTCGHGIISTLSIGEHGHNGTNCMRFHLQLI